MEDPKKIERLMDQIESRILVLRKDYDLYFNGDKRVPPERERTDLKNTLARLSATHFRNTALRFRMAALLERFNAFCRLWDRTMYQIETGTYKPEIFRATLHGEEREAGQEAGAGSGKEAPRPAGGPRAYQPITEDEGRMKNLYKTFIESRRVTGENVNLSYDAFRRSIEKQSGTLREKLGSEPDFKVVIENGKAKLKGFSRK